MSSNDTLVDTPFQLISGFFHVNQGILCLLSKLPPAVCLGEGGGGGGTGLLNEGGGEQQASCLVAKQAVEFPQVYTSLYNNMLAFSTLTLS